MSAEPIKALFYPFTTGALSVPPGAAVLWLNAQGCAELAALTAREIVTQQYFRPLFRTLRAAQAVTEIPGGQLFDVVLVSGARQHQETVFMLASALRVLRPGGLLVTAAANDAGGKRLAADMVALGLATDTAAKYKSRIVWTKMPEQADVGACAAALAAGAYQPVLNGAYISRPGIFGWDKIDVGSALLSAHLPPDLSGRGADFGCGYGFLAAHIIKITPNLTALTCIDADARAVEACRRTLEKNKDVIDCLWADITAPDETLPENFDWIVTNPPFHAGKAAVPAIGQAFIERAARCLKPGGVLWMVANAGLPYEDILMRVFARQEKIAEEKGFKIYRAVK